MPVSATPVSVTCVDATPADAHAAVAWTAEEGLSTRIRLAFVDSRAPEPVDGIPIARAAPGMVQGCPQLGASDTDVLIAWSEAPPPEADTRGPHRLHLSWARSDGGVGDPLLVADGLDVVGGYAVMAEADGFLLSWIGALGGQTRVEVVRGELRCPAPTR